MSYERSAQYYDYFDEKTNVAFYVEIAEKTAGNVLEIGVGTGRVLFEIAELGRDVVGLDNSVAMLKEAKRKRREEHPMVAGRCRLLLADMLSFELGERFGFIYSASAGIQTDSADHLRGIFRSVADHLEPNGIFAFDVAAPRAMRETKVFPPLRRELPGGRVVIRFVAQTYNEAADTTSFDLLFKEFIPGRTSTVTVKEEGEAAVITLDVIEDALGYAGLSMRQTYGDFDRSPFTDESRSIVVTAGR